MKVFSKYSDLQENELKKLTCQREVFIDCSKS